MNQIPDEIFLKSVRNRISQIAIKSFNERPRHWDEFKTQIIQSPVRDSLIHEAPRSITILAISFDIVKDLKFYFWIGCFLNG